MGNYEGGKKETIVVNFNKGLVTVEPNSKGADTGDIIIWVCDYPFVVHFKGTSPVNKMIIHSRKEGNIHTADARVVHDSNQFGGVQGSYFIACSHGDAIDAADPDIIVPRDRRR